MALFCGPVLLLTLCIVFQCQFAFSTRDLALALAREAVIRPLDRSLNQSEVTEELVLTASISRRLVYGLPARRKTPDGSDRVREWKRRPATWRFALKSSLGAS
jgi:hypothetical protein